MPDSGFRQPRRDGLPTSLSPPRTGTRVCRPRYASNTGRSETIGEADGIDDRASRSATKKHTIVLRIEGAMRWILFD